MREIKALIEWAKVKTDDGFEIVANTEGKVVNLIDLVSMIAADIMINNVCEEHEEDFIKSVSSLMRSHATIMKLEKQQPKEVERENK